MNATYGEKDMALLLQLYYVEYVYTFRYKHTYIYTYIHTYVHTYIHTYTLACMHTYIHTYIHTVKKDIEALLVASEEICLEVCA
jgi:hypothetical protein